jgi:putative exosortase-associated protein (TIGR04073 family)
MKQRRIAGILFLCVAMTGIQPAAFAMTPPDAGTASYTWSAKLKRGALNIVTSPVEVARQIHITSDEKSLLAGWTLGLGKGLGHGLLRLGAGLVDLLTFPFDFPDSEKAPLVEPEYVWEKPGVKYT